MFQWKPGMVPFMRDAAEYGPYYERLAQALRPNLRADWRICDAGCGLGYLSLALAPWVRQVTAVDVCAEALQVLRENCRTREIGNLDIRQEDIRTVEAERPFDAMVFCCFGDMEEILAAGKRLCDGTLFCLIPKEDTFSFSPGSVRRPHNPFQRAWRCLEERRIPFESRTLELEFGQPFRSLADACRFFEVYRRTGDRTPLNDAAVRGRLRETGERAFPLYLPHPKTIGFLTFETKHIPT